MTNLEKLKELIIEKIKSCKKTTELQDLMKKLNKNIFEASGIEDYISIWKIITLNNDYKVDIWGQEEVGEKLGYYIYRLIPLENRYEAQYIERTNSDLSDIKTTFEKTEKEVYYDYEEAKKTRNKLNENNNYMESWSVGKVGETYEIK